MKMVRYTPIEMPGLFNLGFGDKNIISGDIDDSSVTNNGDTKKVLATVAYTLHVFTNNFPDARIYAQGSTEARTRLYRIGISNNLEWLKCDFDIYGKFNGEIFHFEKNINYNGFYAKRKKY